MKEPFRRGDVVECIKAHRGLVVGDKYYVRHELKEGRIKVDLDDQGKTGIFSVELFKKHYVEVRFTGEYATRPAPEQPWTHELLPDGTLRKRND